MEVDINTTTDTSTSESTIVFLGLSPAQGLIYQWQKLRKGIEKPRQLRFTPWYKLHLTLAFWPSLDFDSFLTLHKKIKPLVDSCALPLSEIQGFHYFQRNKVLFLKETGQELVEYRQQLFESLKGFEPAIAVQNNNDFIPHWTIARKFEPYMLKKYRPFFYELDAFNHSGRANSIALYRSFEGRYEAHPFI